MWVTKMSLYWYICTSALESKNLLMNKIKVMIDYFCSGVGLLDELIDGRDLNCVPKGNSVKAVHGNEIKEDMTVTTNCYK